MFNPAIAYMYARVYGVCGGCGGGCMLVTTGACEIQMKVLVPLELNLVGKCKLVGLVTRRHEKRAGERTSES